MATPLCASLDADGGCKGVELATSGELLLREAKTVVEETGEVALRLLGDGLAP
jgi:hypothetical protein